MGQMKQSPSQTISDKRSGLPDKDIEEDVDSDKKSEERRESRRKILIEERHSNAISNGEAKPTRGGLFGCCGSSGAKTGNSQVGAQAKKKKARK
mmetsp:Transcript_42665/g.65444  ORF Transcript_42665/g.65444 Transcript_42665/m.65444 type:complete len:94 (+) Transcript_42665:1641-1922(+)